MPKGRGKKGHPYTERQRRWAFLAESRGDLPKGTAVRWSRRAKRRKARRRQGRG